MELTKDEMESAKCALIDETSDYILSRVCDVMYEKLIEPIGDNDIELNLVYTSKAVAQITLLLWAGRR